ncbi:MAG TPA: hypothetical protein VEB66_01240 [Opitutaceae bacterium]|nr:hypothetical protein [Opitutaceae bacterium]
MPPPSRKSSVPKAVLAAAAAIALVGWWWARGRSDLQAFHGVALELPGPGVFLALVVLPLAGFPVSILHALAGAKFGVGLGLVLVGVSIALQLAAAYGVVQLAPGFFARRFAWLRRRLPPATHRALTVFVKVLPGAPYVGQIYVLPLANVPFGIYFWYGLPLHFVRAIIGVVFGEWSGDMSDGRVAAFAVYSILITLTCAWAFRRLLVRLQSPPPAEGGRTLPA